MRRRTQYSEFSTGEQTHSLTFSRGRTQYRRKVSKKDYALVLQRKTSIINVHNISIAIDDISGFCILSFEDILEITCSFYLFFFVSGFVFFFDG